MASPRSTSIILHSVHGNPKLLKLSAVELSIDPSRDESLWCWVHSECHSRCHPWNLLCCPRNKESRAFVCGSSDINGMQTAMASYWQGIQRVEQDLARERNPGWFIAFKQHSSSFFKIHLYISRNIRTLLDWKENPSSSLSETSKDNHCF